MKKLIIITLISIVGLAAYLSIPYKGCEEVSVGSGFESGYDCGDRTIYIPK